MTRKGWLGAALALSVLFGACTEDDASTAEVADAGHGDTDASTRDAGGEDVERDAVVPDPAGGNHGGIDEAGIAYLPEELIPGDGEFMVIVLPDTQIYAQRFPETFDSQLRWVAERAETYRIVFVSHVGDIVQTASVDREWEVAQAAYDWLEEIGMPHGFSMGGHDTSPGSGDFDSSCSPFSRTDCDSRQFLANFGPDRYADREWYGGASPSGLSSYQLVEAEGMRLLFLHLPQDTPAAEVEWAGEVLDANPGTLAHLTTHRYLFDYRLTEILPPPLNILPAGRFNFLTYTLGGQDLMYNTGLMADELFQQLVSEHPNIWAVHCGHVDAEFRQWDRNDAGLPVHEILVDYQDMDDGGGGWLRLLIFRPEHDEVDVVTFSTLTGEVRADGDGFEHSLELLESYKRAYGADLAELGLNQEELDRLLAEVREPGELRDQYYESLYGAGQRDSRFTLEVDFDAYIDASR